MESERGGSWFHRRRLKFLNSSLFSSIALFSLLFRPVPEWVVAVLLRMGRKFVENLLRICWEASQHSSAVATNVKRRPNRNKCGWFKACYLYTYDLWSLHRGLVGGGRWGQAGWGWRRSNARLRFKLEIKQQYIIRFDLFFFGNHLSVELFSLCFFLCGNVSWNGFMWLLLIEFQCHHLWWLVVEERTYSVSVRIETRSKWESSTWGFRATANYLWLDPSCKMIGAAGNAIDVGNDFSKILKKKKTQKKEKDWKESLGGWLLITKYIFP